MCRIRRSAWRDELSIRRNSVIVRETRPENVCIFTGKMTIDGGCLLRRPIPPPPSARFPYVRTVAHELGLRFRLGGRNLPGAPHMVFPVHALALFVCDCAAYGHGCLPPRVEHPKCYFEIQRRLRRSELAIFQHVLDHRGWRTRVIYDCATTNRPALEDELRSLTRS